MHMPKHLVRVFLLLLALSLFFAGCASLKDDTLAVRGEAAELLVDLGDCSLAVRSSEDESVRLETRAPEKQPVVAETDPVTGALVIRQEDRRSFFERLFSFSRESARATLYLPADSLRKLTARLGSGNFNAEGDLRFSVMWIHTGSGNAALDDCFPGSLLIETGSGNVAVSGCEADSLTIRTGSGNIALLDSSSASDAELRTKSGAAAVHGFETPASLAVYSFSGDIGLGNADAASLTVDTGSGDVVLDGMRAASASVASKSGGVLGTAAAEGLSGTYTDSFEEGGWKVSTVSGRVRVTFED